MKTWLLGAAALAASLLVAPAALADAEKARAHFEKGTAFYNLARFKDAVTEFEAGYLQMPDPMFLYNVGQCHRQLGNNAEALRFYRNYLRNAPKATNRADVERKIKELESAITEQEKLRAAAPRETAPLPGSLGNPPPSPAPPPPADATAPVALPAAPPPADSQPPQPAATIDMSAASAGPEAGEQPVIYKRWWFWTGVGAVVLVGVVVAIAAGGSGDPACPAGFMCRGK